MKAKQFFLMFLSTLTCSNVECHRMRIFETFYKHKSRTKVYVATEPVFRDFDFINC